MDKRSYIIISFIFFFSCSKEEKIPAYIKINSIELNENHTTEKITDAWVYIENELQGVYELPAKFPVLETGNKEIRIRAGIKNNGIATSRIYYPFYASYIIENFNLIAEKEHTLSPVVNYVEEISFFLEDFEGVGLEIDTTNNSNINFIIINSNGNSYGYAELHDSINNFEIATEELTNLPKNGAPVFLELDYKSNTEFLTGIYINEATIVIKENLVWVREKDEWNKIYINLTPIISSYTNATSFKLFIKMERNFSILENKIYFDNIKLVY